MPLYLYLIYVYILSTMQIRNMFEKLVFNYFLRDLHPLHFIFLYQLLIYIFFRTLQYYPKKGIPIFKML